MSQYLQPDYSHLPEVAWISILKQLSLEDRYRLSQTCHTLQEHFHHPSVWHTVTIKFTAEDGKMPGELLRRPRDVHLTRKYKQMIEQYGCYFQDLTLVFYGIITGLSQEHRDIIAELGKSCRLRSLTLEVGIAPSTLNENDLSMSKTDLESVSLAVTNAFRLKCFFLKSWPSFDKVNILQRLVSNERLKNLDQLNLLYRCATESTWSTVSAPIPEIIDVLQAVKHFNYLTSFSLRSDLLTTEVVEELSKAGRLKCLQVMVIYSPHTKKGLYEISRKSWTMLSQSCPQLQIHVNFVNRIPYVERSGYMKREMPVTEISFMKFSSCSASDIQSFSEKYCKTLTKFTNYSDSGDFDEQLMSLVDNCSHMTHFSSCGPITANTVLQLAATRGDKWHKFEVKEDMVVFKSSASDYDENAVISTTSSGEVVMTQMERRLADLNVDENRQLQDFANEVSTILHRRWAPVPENFMEEDLTHLQRPRVSIN